MLKLTKRKEPLFALSCLGPNFINLFLSIYLLNAIQGNMSTAIPVFNYDSPSTSLINVAVFTVLLLIAKIIDALINLPIAHASDTTKTRWGRRRPCILIGFIIMMAAYACLCNPLFITGGQVLNTIWVFCALIIYFCGYALCLESFYACFPEITYDVQSRIRLTSYKAFYDTIVYSVCYALLPVVLVAIAKEGVNMRYLSLCLLPLYLTMLIPLFLIKEPGTYMIQKQKKKSKGYFQTFWGSIKEVLKNKTFVIWILIFALFYFGLNLFLQAQIPLAQSSMGFDGTGDAWKITIINTAAFAPIPLMLFIGKKVMNRFGFKISFSIAILSFLIAITTFCIGYRAWIPNQWAILAIVVSGSVVGSYGLTTFFSAPFLIPSQLASEGKQTHQAMFFGVQGICIALADALNEPIWTYVSQVGKNPNYNDQNPHVYNTTGEIGPHIVTYVVIGVCSLAFIFSFFMPKVFDHIGKIETKTKTSVVTSTNKWYKNIFRWFIKVTGCLPWLFTFKPRFVYEDKKIQGRRINGSAIIAANHIRILDPILIGGVFSSRYVRTLIGEVIYDNYGPFTRHVFNMLGGVRVSRYMADPKYLGECEEILNHGGVIQIFPEAHIPKKIGDPMQPFKSSAVLMSIQTKAPIIPVWHNGTISATKREVVVIGKPIFFHNQCSSINPSAEELQQLTKILQDKVGELKLLAEKK